MNEKEYYVNQIEKLKISDEIKQQVLQNAPIRKKTLVWHRFGAAAAVLVAVLALFVVPSPLSNQVKAYCELAANTINGMIYGGHADVSTYVTQIKQVETDGDLSVQLNEVMLDGDHLIYNYTVASTAPKFYKTEQINSETFEGYYDLGIRKITINGKSIEYPKDEILFEGFYEESTDSCTYPVLGEQCLYELKEVLTDPEELLDIKMEVVARSPIDSGKEGWDYRYFTFGFTVKNRDLQLETKEIPINQTFVQDDVTITIDKLCINTYSQKIYFNVTGMPERKFRWGNYIGDDPYEFGIEGTDSNGNEIFSGIQEIRNGYGYFELHPYSDTEGLDYNVKYYDFQMEYSWDDPAHVVTDDEHEGIRYGKGGNVGEPFRVDCR